MIRILFTVLLLFNFLIGKDNKSFMQALYFDDSIDSKVKSKEFFLSNDNISPTSELNNFLRLLKGSNGEKVACNYPYRYYVLQKSNMEIPYYDIKKCNELQNFINSFQHKHLALVFTSEYTNNPSSAFGHIMLLFYDDKNNMAIGDTVHFAAKTDQDVGFFKYIYNGIFGKNNGYFIREPFFKKIYEYNMLEQRYMYIYTLDFSQEKIKELLYHLFELRKAKFNYYFFDENCASKTTDILEMVLNENADKKSFYLPVDTLKNLKEHIVSEERFIPMINQLDLLISKMDYKQKKNFDEIISTNKNPNPNLDNIVKEALVTYYNFMFRKFHISFKNYDNVMNLKYEKTLIQDKSLDPLKKVQPSNFSIGYYHTDKIKGVSIGYRPLLLDKYDIQSNSMQESEVSNFRFNLIFEKENIYLEKFDFISIHSYHQDLEFYQPISWNIYSGFNRDTVTNDLIFENYIGIGKTYKVADNIFINYIIDLGLEYSDFYKEWDTYLKPQLYLLGTIQNNTKIGMQYRFKEYFNKEEKQLELFLTQKISSDFFITIEHKNIDDKNKKGMISLKYNF